MDIGLTMGVETGDIARSELLVMLPFPVCWCLSIPRRLEPALLNDSLVSVSASGEGDGAREDDLGREEPVNNPLSVTTGLGERGDGEDVPV